VRARFPALVLLAGWSAQAQEGAPVELHADRARVRSDLEVLTGHAPIDADGRIVSRSSMHPDHARARAWIAASLRSTRGMKVSEETLEYGENLANVVADLPGSDPSLPMLIVGAHYDSCAYDTPGWQPRRDPAPGADDDASGTAAVLEIARMLAGRGGGYARGVRLALFDAEEEGLVGSREHARRLRAAGVQISVALVLDPVGYNAGGGNLLFATYDAAFEPRARALETDAAALDTPIRLEAVDEAAFGGDGRADHASFAAEGYAALHLAAFPQPPQYHTQQDDLGIVDVDYVAAVASLVASHVAARAGAHASAPSQARGGCTSAADPWAVIALLLVARRGRSRRRLVCAVLLAACRPSLPVPEQARVACGGDAECPAGFLCVASRRLCVEASGACVVRSGATA